MVRLDDRPVRTAEEHAAWRARLQAAIVRALARQRARLSLAAAVPASPPPPPLYWDPYTWDDDIEEEVRPEAEAAVAAAVGAALGLLPSAVAAFGGTLGLGDGWPDRIVAAARSLGHGAAERLASISPLDPDRASKAAAVFDGAEGQAANVASLATHAGNAVANDASQAAADQGFSLEKTWNCLAAGTRIAAAQPTEVMERRRPPAALKRLVTEGGRILTVTPNHPVLTGGGWVRADAIQVGDYLVCYGRMEAAVPRRVTASVLLSRLRRFILHPHIEHEPPTIDEVFRAAAEASSDRRMVGIAVDFDGKTLDGEVEVVAVDRHLAARLQAPLRQHLFERVFVLTDEELGFLVHERPLAECLAGTPAGAASSLGCDPSGDTFGQDRLGRMGDPHVSRSRLVPQLDSRFAEASGHRGLADPEASRAGLLRQARRVRLNEPGWSGDLGRHLTLDRVSSSSFIEQVAPHLVYDVGTSNGWFLAEGIVVHNSVGDDRVREAHADLEGTTVNASEPFVTIDGDELMFPGDPSAPDDATAGCRCWLTFDSYGTEGEVPESEMPGAAMGESTGD